MPETFKIEKNAAVYDFPQFSLFIGKPKIGKSTVMAKLKGALIVAVDPHGYHGINVESLVRAPSLKTVGDAVKFFFSPENKDFKTLVIDELRSLTQLFDNSIKQKEGVKYSVDIGFGRGAAYMKDDLYNFLNHLRKELAINPGKNVILVGHVDDRNGEIRLDINGKNENLVLSLVDSVGYIDRDTENNTIVNFNIRRGVEFGTRNPYLATYEGALDWERLFKIAQGKEAQSADGK